MIYFGHNKVDLIKQYLVINNKFIDELEIKKLFLIAEKNLEYFGKSLTYKINNKSEYI